MSGLISGPIMLFYIFICLFCFRYIKNNIEKKYLAKYFLIMMLTFPFWDLLVQKGIKTFFEVSGVLEPKVFYLPEKELNGKLDSFEIQSSRYVEQNINNEEIIKNSFDSLLDKKLNNIYLVFSDNKTFFHLYKDNNKIIVAEEKDKQSRFLIKKEIIFDIYLFLLEKEVLIDNKQKLILSSRNIIGFNDIDFFKYIRENIFFLISGNGQPMCYVSSNYYSRSLFQIILYNK